MKQFLSKLNIEISIYDQLIGYEWGKMRNFSMTKMFTLDTLPKLNQKTPKPSFGFHTFLLAMGEWVTH